MAYPLYALRLLSRISPKMRREQRTAVRYAVDTLDGGRPWYGEGLLLGHYAIGLTTPVSLCLHKMRSVSNTAPRTLIGLTCWRCKRLHRAEVARWLAEPTTEHRHARAKITAPGQRRAVETDICKTCTNATLHETGEAVRWPCGYATHEQRGRAHADIQALDAEHAAESAAREERRARMTADMASRGVTWPIPLRTQPTTDPTTESGGPLR